LRIAGDHFPRLRIAERVANRDKKVMIMGLRYAKADDHVTRYAKRGRRPRAAPVAAAKAVAGSRARRPAAAYAKRRLAAPANGNGCASPARGTRTRSE